MVVFRPVFIENTEFALRRFLSNIAAMNQNPETSISLLDAVRDGQDESAWKRMFEIYEPLIEKWLRRFSAPNQDIKDLVQEVMIVVMKKIKQFDHRGHTGAFRGYLREIARLQLLQFWKNKKIQPIAYGDSDFQQVIEQLEVETSELSQRWNMEYDEYVLKSVMNSVKGEFTDQTWQAFHAVTFEERKASEVAETLGISTNAVFVAKSRVLSRVRKYGENIIDL